MSGPEEGHPWLLVRQSRLEPEERLVLAALLRRAQQKSVPIVEVLLDTATYEVEDPPGPGTVTESWVLEEEARGRGLRPHPDRKVRWVRPPELVRELFAAPRVLQLP
jgi:hypothetical protein